MIKEKKMIIRFKKLHEKAVAPARKHKEDAGADQIEYKPALWILDTDTREVEQIYFDIPNKIRRDYIDDIKEHRQELAEMIGNIDGDFEVKFNYRDNFIRMATDMENGSDMVALFNRMLVSNKYENKDE